MRTLNTKNLEETIGESNYRIQKSSISYLVAAAAAFAISYLPSCGGRENTCKSDSDCYNGEVCGQEKCSTDQCGDKHCNRQCEKEGSKSNYELLDVDYLGEPCLE